METILNDLDRTPVVATYQANRDIYERIARDWPEFAPVLVHVDLPFPAYQTQEEWDQYGMALYVDPYTGKPAFV